MSVLSRVLDRVTTAARSGRPVVVYDLDSTLFSTAERNWAILQEFAAASGPPTLRPVLERLSPADMGWNVMDDLRRSGFADPDALGALRQFWFERFFRDDYLHHDRPLPGAPEFVRDTYDAGATIVYLTGRDEPGMGRGTRASLVNHGFPLGDDRTVVRLKPRFEDEDLAFKRSVFSELRSIGDVVAAFENEPVNANLFCQEFPSADVLFLETVHSPNPPPLLERIVRIKDFRR